jgi:hypothetical protein
MTAITIFMMFSPAGSLAGFVYSEIRRPPLIKVGDAGFPDADAGSEEAHRRVSDGPIHRA